MATILDDAGRSNQSNGEDHVERKLRALLHSWGLSRFSEEMAWSWMRRYLGSSTENNATSDDVERVRKWILMQLNHQRRPAEASSWQVGCPELIPCLRATPVWDCAMFAWIQRLESAFPVIKQELLALRGRSGFQPYRAPSWASDIHAQDGSGSLGHDAGDWNVFYLFLHNMDFKANRQRCPATVSVIESIPGHYEHAFFSALAPRTHIKKHHGPTNKKLRCHLPLVVPENQCRLRAGDEVIHVKEGKCFLFDDSFEHEAWNDDEHHSRIVLIVDIWHPDLTMPELKFLSFLRNAQLRMGKKHASDDKDNFFNIIKDANEANLSEQHAIWS
ncbi:hypothetical protein Poli38472_000849 [Pythium oligandrum]|uniref:Aspartyl/asparaginy/proline hydroxylase domain-containing protein n=1 Tax=Pythium oligandrum TaxID=41045 RepID=A0A8K1CEL3_PYTOL|nr:hypothetical protein Poli38472_000849 [Pythium oligandrum]|eukprot:TMW60807.1 hypothetical protein Poli38472_000849 [Pythium oligandrum]